MARAGQQRHGVRSERLRKQPTDQEMPISTARVEAAWHYRAMPTWWQLRYALPRREHGKPTGVLCCRWSDRTQQPSPARPAKSKQPWRAPRNMQHERPGPRLLPRRRRRRCVWWSGEWWRWSSCSTCSNLSHSARSYHRCRRHQWSLARWMRRGQGSRWRLPGRQKHLLQTACCNPLLSHR